MKCKIWGGGANDLFFQKKNLLPMLYSMLFVKCNDSSHHAIIALRWDGQAQGWWLGLHFINKDGGLTICEACSVKYDVTSLVYTPTPSLSYFRLNISVILYSTVKLSGVSRYILLGLKTVYEGEGVMIVATCMIHLFPNRHFQSPYVQ